jgi:hypothetical protein
VTSGARGGFVWKGALRTRGVPEAENPRRSFERGDSGPGNGQTTLSTQCPQRGARGWRGRTRASGRGRMMGDGVAAGWPRLCVAIAGRRSLSRAPADLGIARGYSEHIISRRPRVAYAGLEGRLWPASNKMIRCRGG